MRFIGAAFEFGVELNSDVERTVGYFHRFHQTSVGGKSADFQTSFGEDLAVVVVVFVAVAVAFGNFACSVTAFQYAARNCFARICTQS